MQVETNEEGEVETLAVDAETDTGPRRDLTDDLPGGLGGATVLPRRDFTDEDDGPNRDLTLEVAVEDEVEEADLLPTPD